MIVAKAEVRSINGCPAVYIDGSCYPFTQTATVRTHTPEGILFDEEYFKGMGEAGIKLFYITCDTEWGTPGSVGLFAEECRRLLAVIPDAYIMVRIGLHPPVEFTEKHPEECFTYNDGSTPPVVLANETFRREYPHLYSQASAVWREKAKRELLKTCDRFDELDFADRIVGYFFAAGGTSEWYYLLNLEDGERYGDLSQAFLADFRIYLQEKYKTEATLKAAWRDENATFRNPGIPDKAGRFFAKQFDEAYWREDEVSAEYLSSVVTNGTNIGSFLDVDRYMKVLDFYRAWHLSTARSQVFFAQAIKERYQGEKLTGAFYGSFGCTDFFDGSTAGGVLEILDSGVMDFLAAPGVYVNRQPGGFTGQREVTDSFSLRGRLFIVEEDTRTHLEVPHFRAMFDYYDIEDTVNVLKRDFGRNLCENLPAWWYDHHVGGGRYKDADIYKLFAQQTKIAKESLCLPDRRKGNEIALIYDEESIHAISNQSTKELVEYFNNYEVARIGAGADRYFHNDLSDPDMPDYKLYIFLNTLVLTQEERSAIQNKLRKNNAVALWVYASGIIDPDSEKRFSVEHISELTGIKMAMLPEKHHTKYRVKNTACGIFDKLNKRRIYGVNDRAYASNILVVVKDITTFACPVFYAADEKAQTAAAFLTNGLPAVSVKDCGGYRSVFCGSKILNADIVREAARFAGCHIWCESGDVVYASDNYLCIHASSDGEKQLYFKHACSPCEVYEKRYYGENVSELAVHMVTGQTLTFSLRPVFSGKTM